MLLMTTSLIPGGTGLPGAVLILYADGTQLTLLLDTTYSWKINTTTATWE